MTTTTSPVWATETIEPDPETGENGWHRRTIAIGDASITVEQYVDNDGPYPVIVVQNDYSDLKEWDAQGCRDFAAALLKAAEIIDNA